MILGFSTINPFTKKPTHFVKKILDNSKIHSMRAGERWRKGQTIQMATGVRTKNYAQFNTQRPDLKTCTGTQKISFVFEKLSKTVSEFQVFVDGRKLTLGEMNALSRNDGFDTYTDFLIWVIHSKHKPKQIVHWTDFRY